MMTTKLKHCDIVCFSHLRWNFVYQRPQHLLSRFGRYSRVFFVEEPVFGSSLNYLEEQDAGLNILILTPHLQDALSVNDTTAIQKKLLDDLFKTRCISNAVFWYYTPMALSFTEHLEPLCTVYDCMDELSAFKCAPPDIQEFEERLMKKADVVFTGGESLFKEKKRLHGNIHPFPSSIDRLHFVKARKPQPDPCDQQGIPHPRFGFFGVIDERMNIDLVRDVAIRKPDWQFIFIGPVVKIDPATLPQLNNIHYLGGKSYNELPGYLSGWDVAIIPFELNDSTKFISPTKTPEYLAAGVPVISSSIRDIVHPYGEHRLVHIADTPEEFIRYGEAELSNSNKASWLKKVDAFLKNISWDRTWTKMTAHLLEVVAERSASRHRSVPLNSMIQRNTPEKDRVIDLPLEPKRISV